MTEKSILTRARLCLSIGEACGSRGKHPANVYNVLADTIQALEALGEISNQKLLSEMTNEEVGNADWCDGFQAAVTRAREALK